MIVAGDFGGTRLKLGLVERGQVLATTVVESVADQPSRQWLPQLRDTLADLIESAAISEREIIGMVWALPLIIHPSLRRATQAFGKFADATAADFCDQVEACFGLPVLLEGDARAAAIGEWQVGSGRGCEDLVMLTLGTGLGTGVILGGGPLRGRRGMAGTLGGLSITHLGQPGTSQVAPGCTEAQIATWALRHQATAQPDFAASTLAAAPRLDYHAVLTHAAQGDALAMRLRDRAIEGWAALTVNLIQAYDPQRVVIGGGIMASAELILPGIRQFVAAHAIQPAEPVEVVAGALGDSAALIGCEWVWHHAHPS